MQSGNPIAFYEIAATLIPLLLFGGVVLDNLHPPSLKRKTPASTKCEDQIPDEHEQGDNDRSATDRMKALLIVSYLPIIALVVIVAEGVALDTVVTGKVDSFHAKFVGGALLMGMMAVVLAVWVPWVVEASDGSVPKSLLFVFSAVFVVVSFWFQPWVSSPVSDLAQAIEEQPPRQHAPSALPYRERVWLEHLIATSDYRIDKLKVEAVNSSRSVRANVHLRTQEDVLARECAALRTFAKHSNEVVDSIPACSG